VSRRRFVQLVSGGIVVFVSCGPTEVFSQEANRLYPKDYNAYLVVGKNGRIAVFSGKIEMGQGVLTSQAQMVAEELGVSLTSIDMVLGDTDKCPADMGTFGSLTTRMFGPVLRAAAAQARVELVALAAQKLGAAPDSLLVEHGTVFVAGQPRRRVSYGELSRGARIVRTVQSDAILRSASEFQVIGASPKRLDWWEKVTGAARYAADVRVPGMLYARLLRPPTHGATLLQLDTSGIDDLPGITLINQDGVVAVLHTDPEGAEDALGRTKPLWQGSTTMVDPESIHERLVSQAATLKTLAERGNVAAARSNTMR